MTSDHDSRYRCRSWYCAYSCIWQHVVLLVYARWDAWCSLWLPPRSDSCVLDGLPHHQSTLFLKQSYRAPNDRTVYGWWHCAYGVQYQYDEVWVLFVSSLSASAHVFVWSTGRCSTSHLDWYAARCIWQFLRRAGDHWFAWDTLQFHQDSSVVSTSRWWTGEYLCAHWFLTTATVSSACVHATFHPLSVDRTLHECCLLALHMTLCWDCVGGLSQSTATNTSWLVICRFHTARHASNLCSFSRLLFYRVS